MKILKNKENMKNMRNWTCTLKNAKNEEFPKIP